MTGVINNIDRLPVRNTGRRTVPVFPLSRVAIFSFSHLIDIFRHSYVAPGTTLFEIVLELTTKILSYICARRFSSTVRVSSLTINRSRETVFVSSIWYDVPSLRLVLASVAFRQQAGYPAVSRCMWIPICVPVWITHTHAGIETNPTRFVSVCRQLRIRPQRSSISFPPYFGWSFN